MFDKGFAGGHKDREIIRSVLSPGYYTQKDQFALKAKHSDLKVYFHPNNRFSVRNLGFSMQGSFSCCEQLGKCEFNFVTLS